MPARKYSTDAIAEALASSDSIRNAGKKIGMSMTALESRCREEGLIGLYGTCAERGKALRGKAKTERRSKPLPHWLVMWTPPGAPPVQIWHRYEATVEDARAVAMTAIPLWIRAEDVSIVEEDLKR